MIAKILQHVRYWGETYIAGPIVVALLILSAWLVGLLTGRDAVEDIGAIVGTLIDAVRLVVVIIMAGLTQHFLFGYRSNDQPYPPIGDDIHDSCVTCFLLLLYSVLLFGLIR